jgi:small-conductance mechanosensitive channel
LTKKVEFLFLRTWRYISVSEGVANTAYQRPGIKGKVVKVGLTDVWFKDEEGGVIIASNGWLRAGPIINYTARNASKENSRKKQAIT